MICLHHRFAVLTIGLLVPGIREQRDVLSFQRKFRRQDIVSELCRGRHIRVNAHQEIQFLHGFQGFFLIRPSKDGVTCNHK